MSSIPKKERRGTSIQQVALMSINSKVQKAKTNRIINNEHDKILGILDQVGEMDIEDSKEISSLRCASAAQLYPSNVLTRSSSKVKEEETELSELIERSNGLYRSSELKEFVRSIILACSIQSVLRDDDSVFRGPLKRFEFIARHGGIVSDVLRSHGLIRQDEALSKEYETIDTKFDNAKYDIAQAMCKSDCERAGNITDRAVRIFMNSPLRCYIKASSETGTRIDETLDMFRTLYDQTNVSDVEFWSIVLTNHISEEEENDGDCATNTMLSSLGISMIDNERSSSFDSSVATATNRSLDYASKTSSSSSSMTMSKIQQKFEAEQRKKERWKF